MVQSSHENKFQLLVEQLNEREGAVIIFVKTKMGTERLAEKLSRDDHESIAIHGDLRQQKRERVINSFRKGATRIMVATDVVARGLDIPHIQHVINYDLPQCPEDYIHRIGRTARAGAQGSSLCLISAQDAKKWFAIQRFMDPSAKEDRSYSSGGGSKSNAGRGFGGAGRKSDPYAKPHRKSRPESSGARFGDKEGGAVPSRKGESFWDQNPSASRSSSSPRPNRNAPADVQMQMAIDSLAHVLIVLRTKRQMVKEFLTIVHHAVVSVHLVHVMVLVINQRQEMDQASLLLVAEKRHSQSRALKKEIFNLFKKR